jgi:Zn-finger nucleic acid-binding protein
MKCPVCKEPMIVLELNQVEIDYCHQCEGIWLDSGELDLLLEGSKDKENVIASLSKKANINEKKIKCPLCRKKMDKIKTDYIETIILDKCVKGEGLWFNKNELHKVLLAGNLNTNNPVFQQLKSIFEYKFKKN